MTSLALFLGGLGMRLWLLAFKLKVVMCRDKYMCEVWAYLKS